MTKFLYISLIIVGCLALLAGVSAAMGAFFMLLWNVFAVALGAPPLTFLQAWAGFTLLNMLISGAKATLKVEK